ncbi:MAG: hypothetical protein JXA30_22050 [Deltaproteobacteria bacterium]|nr:hypothetical protein [Deltaproteobacteria bacterium]
MLYKRRAVVGAGAYLLAHFILAACGSKTASEAEAESRCSVEETASCRCAGNKVGVKTCLKDGSYSKCKCAASEKGTSGVSADDDSVAGTPGSSAEKADTGDGVSAEDEHEIDVSDEHIDAGATIKEISDEESDAGDEAMDSALKDQQTESDSSGGSETASGGSETASGGSETASGGSETASGGSGGIPESGTGGSGGDSGNTGGAGSGGYEDYQFFCDHGPTSLPKAKETCPKIVTTVVDVENPTPLTFRGKQVEIIAPESPDPNQKGPLVFCWHGLGGQAYDAFWFLGVDAGLEILARGGVIVSMYASETVSGTSIAPNWDTGHLDAADEVLACAIEQFGIDTCRIHALGFSAGGLMTTQMSYRRSSYLASVVVYSGGIYSTNIPIQDPNNMFAAMIAYGGTDDVVYISFKDTSQAYLKHLLELGHFAFACDHGGGHVIPDDIIAPAWKFLKDHPYGVAPEPYKDGLPAVFPSYCSL